MNKSSYNRPHGAGDMDTPYSFVTHGRKAALYGSVCIGFSGNDLSGAAALIIASTIRLCGGTVYLCDGLTPAETIFAGRTQNAEIAIYIGDDLTPNTYPLTPDSGIHGNTRKAGRLLFLDHTEKKYTESFKSYDKIKGLRISVGSEGRGNRLFRIAAVKAGAIICPPEHGLSKFFISEDGLSLSIVDEAGISHDFHEISHMFKNKSTDLFDGIQTGFSILTKSVEKKATVASLFSEEHDSVRAEKTLWVNGGAQRALTAFYRKYSGEAKPYDDGYVCDFGDEKVKIYPCHSGKQVKIAAESYNTETALELCSGMEMIIERLTADN